MIGDGLLLVEFSRCNAPARIADWHDWYDDVHLPAVAAAGVDVATRFEVFPAPVPGMPSIGFSHLALYEFKGESAEERLDRAVEVAGTASARSDVHPNHCLIDLDSLVAHGRSGSKSNPTSDLEGHILAYVMANQVARHDEWDDWYDATHLPDMMESGAFRAGSRWRRRLPKRFGANDLTLYDVAGMSVEQAVEMSAAVMPGIASRGRKLDCHVGAMSFTVKICGKRGGAGLRG